MSRREEPEQNSAWETILSIFAALYNAIRQGLSSLVQYYRNLLANYGYYTSV